jgi:ABC-type lipoprotein export system ATPase subunit
MFNWLKGFGQRTEAGEALSLIDLRSVKKAYKTDAGEFLALKGIDLKIDRGEFVAIIGKSGSGKSTLINMMTGIDRPTSGEIYVNSTGIHTFNEDKMAQWRGRNMGVVFQFFQLLPTLTVLENVMLPMDFCNLYTPRQRRERALYLLELVEVEKQANKLPSMLSGGQQQRVAIARALANDPPIIVADEPTGNLDSRTANTVFELFQRLVDEGKTFLMVTHDDSLKERTRRQVTIADGEIVDEEGASGLPGMTAEQDRELTRGLQRLTFAPGMPILNGSRQHTDLYIVVSGQVVLERDSEEQRLAPGQFFGAERLLGSNSQHLNAYAAPEVGADVVRLDFSALTTLLQQSDTASRALLDLLARQQHAAVNGH